MTKDYAEQITTDWVAADWSASSLRLWIMGAGGQVLERRHADRVTDQITPASPEAKLLDLIGDSLPPNRTTPVICCGTIPVRQGQGWSEQPCRPVPCPPDGIDGAIHPVTDDPRLRLCILPGLCQSAPADMMHGDETRIAGWLTAHPGFDGVLCLPGAQSRWAHVSAGEVVSFRSFMTGELFRLLSSKSFLHPAVAKTGLDQIALTEAVAHAMSRPAAVAADLFSIHAQSRLTGLDPVVARSRLSGLLIGIELAAARPYWLGQDIAIIGGAAGTGGLADSYATALAAQGLSTRHANAEDMTLNGLRAAHAALEDRS